MLITAIMTFSKLLFVTIFASITYIIQLGRKNSKFLGVKIFIFYETSTPRLLYEQTELFNELSDLIVPTFDTFFAFEVFFIIVPTLFFCFTRIYDSNIEWATIAIYFN